MPQQTPMRETTAHTAANLIGLMLGTTLMLIIIATGNGWV